MTELRRPEPLDAARHDRSSFDCGETVLDEWLRRYAGQSRRANTAATWVITDESGLVVAYVALSMTAIEGVVAPSGLRQGSPELVPTFLPVAWRSTGGTRASVSVPPSLPTCLLRRRS